jgi:transcriptional regulator with XRE-family HTH domain
MSQERLGDALGLTFQQVQKYERGVNRVGASRLFDLSRILDVPINYFYENMQDGTGLGNGAEVRHASVNGFAEQQDGYGNDEAMNKRETLELVRAYYRIADPTVRKRMFDLMKSMASTEE